MKRFIFGLLVLLMLASTSDACWLFGIGQRVAARRQARAQSWQSAPAAAADCAACQQTAMMVDWQSVVGVVPQPVESTMYYQPTDVILPAATPVRRLVVSPATMPVWHYRARTTVLADCPGGICPIQ